MRYFVAILFVLAACSVPPPSGNVVALDEDVLKITTLAPTEAGTPVRIEVRGDAVWPRVWIDGAPHALYGEPLGDQFLADLGSGVVTLAPGEHAIEIYSCQDSWIGWRCGCGEGSCNNMMRSSFSVE